MAVLVIDGEQPYVWVLPSIVYFFFGAESLDINRCNGIRFFLTTAFGTSEVLDNWVVQYSKITQFPKQPSLGSFVFKLLFVNLRMLGIVVYLWVDVKRKVK